MSRSSLRLVGSESRPARPRRAALAAVVVVLVLLTAACAPDAPQDTLKPEGPAARTIHNLNSSVMAVAGVIFVVVQTLLLVALFRFRHRADRPEPVQVHGNTRAEITWTIIPAAILAVVAVFTVKTIFDLARTPARALNVTVTGHQWWWEYRYDDLGIVTANELHLPTGRSVELTLRGNDVIHSFWVPRLAGKMDVVPGRANRMSLKTERPGTYVGQCAEYCGLSHANMRLKAVVQRPRDFDAWVANQRRAAAPPAEGTPAAEGVTLFNQKGCGGCHTINGVSKGTVGPDLTHLLDRTTFAAGMLPMSSANLRTWLRDPPGVKPGSKMPNLKLSTDEITRLVAYLETLK